MPNYLVKSKHAEKRVDFVNPFKRDIGQEVNAQRSSKLSGWIKQEFLKKNDLVVGMPS